MEQKLTFTAYLKDEYSKNFENLASKSDKDIKQLTKDLDKFATTGKKVSRNIDEIERRIKTLTQVKKFTIDTRAIKFANQEIKNLQREKEKLEGTPGGGGMFGGMGKGFAVAGGALALGALAKQGIGAASRASMEREQQKITMQTLAGGEGKGNALLGDITKMASVTPFQTTDLIQSTQTLIGFGVEQEKVLGIMRMLGDVSSGNKDRFQSLTLAFSQMSSVGRLMGQDLLQMVNAGFNPLKEISKITGKNMAQLKKDMEDGKISAELVTQAFQRVTAKGGLYYGMMDKQSQTSTGRVSTLKDNIYELAVVTGDKWKPALDAGIDGLSSIVATVRSWMEVPISEKLQQETDRLQTLRTELDFTNTSEKRRKEILDEVKSIQPDIIDGTKSEKDQLKELNVSLDEYISKRRQQISMEQLKEQNIGAVTKYKDAQNQLESSRAKAVTAIAMAETAGFDASGMTQGQAEVAAKKFLSERIKSGKETNKRKVATSYGGMGGGAVSETSLEREALGLLNQQQYKNRSALATIKENSEAYNQFEKTQDSINKLYGIKDGDTTGKATGGAGKPDGTGSGKGKGSSSTDSISGGSKITHLNITIGSLVGGGVNIHSSTVKDGASQMKDHVVEALLTAVNDANLAAN